MSPLIGIVSVERTTLSSMKFSKLYIWGPNPFTNRLLASHVETITAIMPECICTVEELNGHGFAEQSLVFCDCDKLAPLSYCQRFYKPGDDFARTPNIVLMNVAKDKDLLNEIKIYPILGVLYSSDNFDHVSKGIQKIFEGEHWLSRKLLERTLISVREEFQQERSKALPSILTLREREIVKMIGSGHDNQSIADELFISPNTVKTHISNIYKKINVSNRVQTILWASENAMLFMNGRGGEDSV